MPRRWPARRSTNTSRPACRSSVPSRACTEGERQEETEYLCLLKTPLDGLERLVSFVRERHPYDTPEITAVESLFTDERYLAWAREVSGESAGGVPLPAGPSGPQP